MAIGGGKRERDVRRKTGTRRGASAIGKDSPKSATKKRGGAGSIGTRKAHKPTPLSAKERAQGDRAMAINRARKEAKGHSRTGSSKAQIAKVRADARARAAAKAAPKQSRPSRTDLANKRTKKVGKVASKVAARTGKSKQASRAAARRIIKKRKNK